MKRKFLVAEDKIYYCSYNKKIDIVGDTCFSVKLKSSKEIDVKKAEKEFCHGTGELSDFFGNKLYSNGKKYYLIYEERKTK